MLVAWLDDVREGMGDYVAVLVEYGVEKFEDMVDMDEDDINKIGSNFEAAGVKPLHSKKVCLALRIRMEEEKAKAEAAEAAAKATRTKAASKRTASRMPHPSTVDSDSDNDHANGNASDRSWHAESSDKSDGDEPDDEESEAEKPRRARGSVPITQRPRARNGTKRMSSATAAAAEGRDTLESMFDKSASASNWHGMGGQASAAAGADGRARSCAPLASRAFGQICQSVCSTTKCECLPEADERCSGSSKCARQLSAFTAGAEVSAVRTPSEIAKITTKSKYNYARLKDFIISKKVVVRDALSLATAIGSSALFRLTTG